MSRPGSQGVSDEAGNASTAPSAWILIPPEPEDGAGSSANLRVWGLSAVERLRRSLERSGATAVEILEAGQPVPVSCPAPCAVFRGDYFYDERLVLGVLNGPLGVLVHATVEAGEDAAVAAKLDGARLGEAIRALREAESSGAMPRLRDMPALSPLDLAPAYNPALRKLDPPFLHRAEADSVRRVENRIFSSSYKGLTDLVTKWVWPLPARELTRLLARRQVHPNTVTLLSYALTLAALGLFAAGWFTAGLVAGWLMTFLDTVDGKLARCTLTSSRLGGALDHGLDLVHPPLWWVAWAYGLAPGMEGYQTAMWIIVGGYLLGRALEGIFLVTFKMEIFLWRPFDGFFRTIISRRNPNLLMLSAGVALGRPDAGYLAVAAWTLICNAIHILRLVQAFRARSRGEVMRPCYQSEEEAQGPGSPSAAGHGSRSAA
jgi:phosphatidylglycerophosphate synthase